MDGQLLEKKDCTSLVEQTTNEAENLVAAGKLGDALDLMLGTEKACRMGNDVQNLRKVCLFMVTLCRKSEDWERLNTTLLLLSKRRQQNKGAITTIVQEGKKYVDDEETPDKETKVRLINTLREITDGKIFVEAERARLTKTLCEILEADGEVIKACDTLGEIHVETYGSLSKREKANFILEQIRLTLAKKDYVRTLIISKKMTKKMIDGKGLEDLKIRFNELMITYWLHEKDAFEVAKYYHNTYSTKCKLWEYQKARQEEAKKEKDNDSKMEEELGENQKEKEEEAKKKSKKGEADDGSARIIDVEENEWEDPLRNAIIFFLLAKFSNEQQDMLHKLYADENVEELGLYKEILKLFITDEIIGDPLPKQDLFLAGAYEHVIIKDWIDTLHVRIVQHNIRALAKHYKRIHLSRASTLLSLPVNEVEQTMSAMVSDGDIYARIDRPADIVNFTKAKEKEEILSDWASDIKSLLGLVETTCHLIAKENMIHKVTPN